MYINYKIKKGWFYFVVEKVIINIIHVLLRNNLLIFAIFLIKIGCTYLVLRKINLYMHYR